ncbi:peroxisome biogenesis factor 7 [Capsaspora owczarzaki ATCC 30864]|uniref:Peroxin-7 n=1 Tax=Capsaspora owczarzaki (strain ATCC 30864) TaxID=595528 RepID=A0A0D2W0J9_CAPO3|nr:peroxisome biogenesis factor 7 [Capsaspora owczarzaki ATCC 30864]KJE97737.1 peroxisome biogenesis factor 7 [Capsaspora owczarzaki ATCC 30864]|eukprot:XP_004342914.1 peroxisome biogenesis factor 7 [Capsaspora owczarzaki ATCC 30864]
MQRWQTPGLHGCGLQFSPFVSDRIAVAASQHYAIAGRGALLVYGLGNEAMVAGSRIGPGAPPAPGASRLLRRLDYKDSLFDVCWSELSEHHALTSSGDGSVQLWDVSLLQAAPVRIYAEHTKEVMAVNWSMTDKRNFVSASWDGTVKLWDPTSSQSLATFAGHRGLVYDAMFHPRRLGVLASVSADGGLMVWDVRRPATAVQRVQAHNTEVISMDWNKYSDVLAVTGSVDRTIKGWDLRRAAQPLFVLEGHDYSIRRVRCSPHHSNVIMSCSYDMTVRVWDTGSSAAASVPGLPPRPRPNMTIVDEHPEFVVGIDFNLAEDGVVANCAWDETVSVFNLAQPPGPAMMPR